MIKLTNDNYFSPEASMEYFGVSQLKSFDKCEAMALAECKGEYKQEMSTALLVGSYVDAYFEGTLLEFENAHPELFKKDGSLKADYVHVNKIIRRIHKDPLFMEYMAGEKQVIKTGEIDGFPFKIKIDSYHPGRMIVDLKVMRSLERIAGRSFVDYWNYNLQGAVYKEIEGDNLPFYLAAATKEDDPDLAIVELDPVDMNESLEYFRTRLPRWAAIKRGEIEPERCECCAYCRRTKVLKEPIPAAFVGFTTREIKAMKGEY
jgi:hypothetical protein